MSEAREYKFQVSDNFNGVIIVARDDTLTGVVQEAIALREQVKTKYLETSTAPTATTEPQPAQSSVAPKCGIHGMPKILKEGYNKQGKHYKGYFCSVPRCAEEPTWMH